MKEKEPQVGRSNKSLRYEVGAAALALLGVGGAGYAAAKDSTEVMAGAAVAAVIAFAAQRRASQIVNKIK